MPGSNTIHVLLATLGGQPQVVTFTLDLLLERGIPISEVIVIHPAAYPRLQQSIARLNAEFIEDRYIFKGKQRTIHFRQQVLRYYGNPVDDIIDEQTANGALDSIGELIQELKDRHYTIHFSITGGRRLMTFLSFSAALLYFEQLDQLFHLYTPDEVQERAKKQGLMHVTPEDGVRLIEVPFTRATHPILSRMLNSGASTAINAQNAQHQAEERTHCTHVYDKATPRQREVLRAFAKGLMPQQVMEELTITLPTVHNHKSALLNLCHEAWKIPEQQRLDYHFLQTRFATYFQSDE